MCTVATEALAILLEEPKRIAELHSVAKRCATVKGVRGLRLVSDERSAVIMAVLEGSRGEPTADVLAYEAAAEAVQEIADRALEHGVLVGVSREAPLNVASLARAERMLSFGQDGPKRQEGSDGLRSPPALRVVASSLVTRAQCTLAIKALKEATAAVLGESSR